MHCIGLDFHTKKEAHFGCRGSFLGLFLKVSGCPPLQLAASPPNPRSVLKSVSLVTSQKTPEYHLDWSYNLATTITSGKEEAALG